MRVLKLILLVQFFCVNSVLSQRNTYVNYEIGTSYHKQEVSPNEVFNSIAWRDAVWSISLEQDVTDKISLAAGIRYQDYRQGTRLDSDPNEFFLYSYRGTGWSETTVLEIPIKAYYNIHLSPRTTISSFLGYVIVPHVGYKSDPDIIETGIATDSLGNTFRYTATESSVAPMIGMFELGARFKFRILNRLAISSYASFRSPLQNEIGKARLTHQFNYGPIEKSTYKHNARFLTLGLQLSYRILSIKTEQQKIEQFYRNRNGI